MVLGLYFYLLWGVWGFGKTLDPEDSERAPTSVLPSPRTDAGVGRQQALPGPQYPGQEPDFLFVCVRAPSCV